MCAKFQKKVLCFKRWGVYGIRTGQLWFKTSGTEHLQCWHSRLHPCSSAGGCVFFCSQGYSPPGRRRCRGHRPYSLAALLPSSLGGSSLAPSACAAGGSWLVGTPPNGNNRKQFHYNTIAVQHYIKSVKYFHVHV